MNKAVHMLRNRKVQVLAAAAILAGTAAVVPAVAAAASPAAPAATPRCGNSAVEAWLGVPGSGAAGSTYYELELSNISGHACTLYGYPGVSAVAPGGAQLGSAAGREAGDPEHLVTLAKNATAHVVLQITDVGNYSKSACDPKNAIGLKVYPPNDTAAQIIPFTFGACAKKGPVYLHVRVTVAGTGIPGYTA